MRTTQYWDNPFSALCDTKDLVEFYVIDVQQERVSHGKVSEIRSALSAYHYALLQMLQARKHTHFCLQYALATLEVAPSHDLSTVYVVRTHLGNIFRAGDHALGYHLANANFNNTNWEDLQTRRIQIPDVVLVRKTYPARKRTKGGSKARNWRLKALSKEIDDGKTGGKADKARAEADYELFLRDLEEDAELRGMINLYKGMWR